MKLEELNALLALEFDASSQTLTNLADLRQLVGSREPTVHELAAFGAYLHNIYNGMENMLKRLAQYYNVPLPDSANWHKQLLAMFVEPAQPPLPSLLDAPLAESLFELLGFRHVFLKQYSLDLEWAKLHPLVNKIPVIYGEFSRRVNAELLKQEQKSSHMVPDNKPILKTKRSGWQAAKDPNKKKRR